MNSCNNRRDWRTVSWDSLVDEKRRIASGSFSKHVGRSHSWQLENTVVGREIGGDRQQKTCGVERQALRCFSDIVNDNPATHSRPLGLW